jgi:hypothetical protein
MYSDLGLVVSTLCPFEPFGRIHGLCCPSDHPLLPSHLLLLWCVESIKRKERKEGKERKKRKKEKKEKKEKKLFLRLTGRVKHH